MATPTLIALSALRTRLRRAVHDTEAKTPGFRIRVTDTEVTSCSLVVSAEKFTTTIIGGSTADLDIDLINQGTPVTIRELVEQIESVNGYEVELDPAGMWEHPSSDLRQTPSTGIEIAQSDYLIQHHAFADDELDDILDDGAASHSPNYDKSSVPAREARLVVMLSHINVCEIMIHDNARFYAIEGAVASVDKGARVDHYKTLSMSLRAEYDALTKRLPFKPESDLDGEAETGAIQVGVLRRTRHVVAARVPFSANRPPKVPDDFMVSSDDTLVSDDTTELFLTWHRIVREINFAYVLIVRHEGDGSKLLDNPYHMRDLYDGDSDFSIVASIFNVARNWYLDEGLTTGTGYAYRMYLFDRNGEWSASSIVEGTTL